MGERLTEGSSVTQACQTQEGCDYAKFYERLTGDQAPMTPEQCLAFLRGAQTVGLDLQCGLSTACVEESATTVVQIRHERRYHA
jgi:hypothetical protein